MNLLRRAGEAIVSLLYPPHCAACRGDTPDGRHLCAGCAALARTIERPFCEVCSQPFDGAIDGKFTCSNCSERTFHFDCAVVRYRSVGVVRELIHRFKYDRAFHLRVPLSEWLIEAFDDPRIRDQPFDYLTPVPLHSARYREREFNQAEALAELAARRTGTTVLRCLKRIRYTTTQTCLDREERMRNLRDAFQVRHTARVSGSHLILVDDVFTTGSTVEECARVLKKAGAASVRVITVARG